MSWHGTSLYIMDPILGQLVAWYSLDSGKKLENLFHVSLVAFFCNDGPASGGRVH